jgi:hypothetical protein
MKYKKQFAVSMLIFPDFYKNEYFDYMKEKINNWIFSCFNAYTDYFTINVLQPSGIAKFYEYDRRTDGSNINFQKIWKNPYGSYYIIIEGFGDILMGTDKSIMPPKELTELTLNCLNFKYKEYSSLEGLKMITFGKESGLPSEYICNHFDSEVWRNFISEEIDCICQNWKIELHVGNEIFDYIFNSINKLIDLEQTNSNFLDIEIDEIEGYISVSGKFLLKNENKEKYFAICQEIAELLIQDDLFIIDEINMDFMAIDKKIFYFEKYSFNDIVGNFQRKSILL